jgi:hypothetical protein
VDDSEQVASDFLRWWANPTSVPGLRSRFEPGFTYQMEPAGLSGDYAVWLIEQSPPWEHVDVKSCSITGDTAALVVEGTDPVTLLRHRVSWSLVIRNGRIASVLERSELLE